jgi:DNA modification methylase
MKVFAEKHGERFSAYNVDCVEFTAQLPENSIDLSIYSPPFSSLYVYSESERDMGNVESDQAFLASYTHLIREKLRITKPGRLTAIHVKDLVFYSNASEKGDRGLRPFSDLCTAAHLAAGWTFHGRVTIWRDPVREMQKTKADRLLFKHFREDAARSSTGLPEYLLIYRAWKPGMENVPAVVHDPKQFPLETWQEWASPVWMNTRETDTLNVRVVRDDEAEKHLCPMPLDIIERGVRMYSNERETVFSPFMGIGSEGFVSLKANRRFVGTELKESYYRQAVKYLSEAEASAGDLLRGAVA